MRIPLACCLLSCVLAVGLLHFSSLPSLFSISIACFILSFSCRYNAVSSVSVSAATRLAYDTCLDMYYAYADLTFFFVLRYDLVQLLCVLASVFYLFSS